MTAIGWPMSRRPCAGTSANDAGFRCFFFRGPQEALNLRAANLARFVELADGVDEGTWVHHLGKRHYSAWVRDMIKDPELAAEIESVEATPASAAESRRRVMEAIRGRYAV